jgi:acyl-CoA thioester hydrolase
MPLPPGTYDTMIRESHLDAYGHVNNAAYLILFEEARWEFITQNGYGLEDVRRFQKGPIVLELSMRFIQEIRLRESIHITTGLLDYRRKIGHFQQKMLKADGTVAAELALTLGFFDLVTRRLIDPTPEWKKTLGLA